MRETYPLIGFEPEHPFQAAGGNGFVIVGVIGVCVGIDAGGSDGFGDHHVAAGRVGILAHQVFEQMSEAGPPRRFMFGADGEAQVEVHQRQGVVGMQNHLHAVGELVVFEIDLRLSAKPGGTDKESCDEARHRGTILPRTLVTMLQPSVTQGTYPRSVIPTSASVSPIITTTVTHDHVLNQRGLVHSPIRSLLVDQQDHEDQHERQQHAVEHLREQNHPHQREIRESGSRPRPPRSAACTASRKPALR